MAGIGEAGEKVAPFQVLIEGRVEKSEHIKSQREDSEGFFRTIVVKPSSDNYSYPLTFAVCGSAPLAPVHQDVSVVCNLKPRNKYNAGQTFYNAQLWLVEEESSF